MKRNHRSRRPESPDIRFVRRAGQIMLQWEQQRAQEVEKRLFLLKPDAQDRLDFIRRCVRACGTQPVAFRIGFDPLYNQINITLEEYLFSDHNDVLPALLVAADAYSLDALVDGRLALSLGIHDAATEIDV